MLLTPPPGIVDLCWSTRTPSTRLAPEIMSAYAIVILGSIMAELENRKLSLTGLDEWDEQYVHHDFRWLRRSRSFAAVRMRLNLFCL